MFLGFTSIPTNTCLSFIASYSIFRFHLTHILPPNASNWIRKKAFHYANGSLNAPLLRRIPDSNFLSDTVRVLGFVLLGIGVTFCLGNALWIVTNSNHRVLVLSQPTLLLQLCLGTAMIVTTILPISVDENWGMSQQQLSISCKVIPWLIVLGQIIQYMALFTKVRVDMSIFTVT
jgi:hypothetical protein